MPHVGHEGGACYHDDEVLARGSQRSEGLGLVLGQLVVEDGAGDGELAGPVDGPVAVDEVLVPPVPQRCHTQRTRDATHGQGPAQLARLGTAPVGRIT